jgi:uncharacterized membrane protein
MPVGAPRVVMPGGVQEADDPLQILRVRLARGEITREQYEEMVRLLQSGS